MSRLTSKLRNKVEVLTKQRVENDLGEYEYKYLPLKNIYVQIRKNSSKLEKGQADTIKVDSTHIVKCRSKSIPNLDNTYRFKYREQKYEVKWFDPDFKNNEFFEIYTQVIIE